MTLYPVFLDLAGAPVLVVGGGAVALRRARGLLEAGAVVRVVAPEFRLEFLELPLERRLRGFEPADLDGVRLAWAATNAPEVNALVAREARARGVWVNDAEAPERGNLFLGAVHRDGEAAFAVSSGGASPRLAARLRDRLAGAWPLGLGARLEGVRRERAEALALPPAERAERLAALEARLEGDLFGGGA